MLIILYGDRSKGRSGKQQMMINGRATCGYREYARNFGHIIYLCPQNVRESWEHSIIKPKNVLKFISNHPNSIIWSVKYSKWKDVNILSKIKNKKLYYSCNSKNMYNNYCNVSLVDTEKRVKGNAKVWFKGKDPDYWKPLGQKKDFDYLLIGKRGDKNEVFFLNKLNAIKDKRRILWIGGKKHQNKIRSNHEVVCTNFVGQDEVRDLIPRAKVGILFTELRIEGFPQAFLEMTMCGVPVVYNKRGPKNNYYFNKYNSSLCLKKNLVLASEKLLHNHDSVRCREEAIKKYSIQKSYGRMIECLN
ncbi:MAG: glycosyltransferase [Candidatus Thorarchaeota archaeon]